MVRLWVAAAFSIALASESAVARAQAPGIVADPVLAGAATATDIPYAEAGTRLTVPVAVAGSGPYQFVIDTGAERTVVSRELAIQLGLATGRPVSLTSMVDRSLVQTVVVPALSIQSIGEHHMIHAPSLNGRDLGATGILGIDTLRNHKVTIDFDQGVMTVDKSADRPMKPRRREEIIVSGSDRFDQMILTRAYIGRTPIQVVLDTGTEISIGNSAMLRLINERSRKTLQPTIITSVTGAKAPASYTLVRDIRIERILFGKLPVAFADVEPFRYFELEETPALLLGMDALRSFRRVEIDFPNRQIRFRMPRPDPRIWRPNPSSTIPGFAGASSMRSY